MCTELNGWRKKEISILPPGLDTALSVPAWLLLLGTLVGTAGGIIVSGKLVNYRIEQLEKKVEKHNNLITRTFRLEQAVALLDERARVANHRISDLEKEEVE